MRTYLVGLILLATGLASPGLRAQNLPEVLVLAHAGKRGTILQQLDLSPAQLARISTLLDEEKAQRKQRLTHRPDETEHAARLAREADFETKMEAVLTPAQYAKYVALRHPQPPPRLPEMKVPGL